MPLLVVTHLLVMLLVIHVARILYLTAHVFMHQREVKLKWLNADLIHAFSCNTQRPQGTSTKHGFLCSAKPRQHDFVLFTKDALFEGSFRNRTPKFVTDPERIRQ